MAFFGNKRKDFSIQPPRQQVDGTPFYVTDSANIDFTLANLNLTANLTTTGVTAGTYGDATHIPILQIDQWGRITGVTTTTFSATGILLQTNGITNATQTILNLIAGTNMTITDDGLGNITFDASGGGGLGTVTSVSAGTGMNFTTITGSGSVDIDTTKVPYYATTPSNGLLNYTGGTWGIDTSAYITASALSPYLLSTVAASTYEPIIAAGTTSQYWRGDKTWQAFPTIPTVGTWGALNYPTWTTGTPFVKMTAAGTFALDTNTYLTTAVTSVGTGTGLTGGTITSTGSISLNTKLAPADSLTGNSLKYLRVNAGETAVEYATVTSSGNSIQALTGDVTASASSPSQSVAATLKTNLRIGSCGVTFDGGGAVITSGKTAYVQVPYAGTITAWTIGADISGSCTITAFKDTYANFPPVTTADDIFVTAPALSSQQKNTNASPTFNGSQATITAGDWIGFTITSITGVTWVNLSLSITKT